MARRVMARMGILSAASLLLTGVAGAAPKTTPGASDPGKSLRLEGVTAVGSRSQAWLVDRKSGQRMTVAPGETVLGFRVRQVEPERVVLSRSGRQFTLRMGDQGMPITNAPSAVMASDASARRSSLHLRRAPGNSASTSAPAANATVGRDGVRGGAWVFDRRGPGRKVEPDTGDTENGTAPVNRGVYPEQGALTNGRGVFPSPVNPLGISGNTGDTGGYPAGNPDTFPGGLPGYAGGYPDNPYAAPGFPYPGADYPVTTYPGGYPWSTGFSGMNPWNLPYGSLQPGTNAAATTGLFGNPQTNRRQSGRFFSPQGSSIGSGNPQTLRRRGGAPANGR